MIDLAQSAKRTNAWACYECGKCTATCPISRVGGDWSPRRQVLLANQGDRAALAADPSVFRCLACGSCDRRCPADVAFIDLVRDMREVTRGEGIEPECPHGGAMQSMMRIQAKGEMRQTRLSWLTGDLETEAIRGEVFYFTGCSMYHDAFFTDLGVGALDGTRAAIQLLNRVGEKPVVSPDERCCGHDLLWNGDREGFERLARHNAKLVEESGAKDLVVSCAECLRTWKLDIAPHFRGKPPRILHLTEFLADRLARIPFVENGARRVTFQDPCRLGRHLGIYDAPRAAIAALPGVELVEMRRSGPGALCCAGGSWTGCDRYSKRIQVERLREARETGADVLVTACPKCRIHFRCAMQDTKIGDEIGIEMMDIAELLAGALGAPESPGAGSKKKSAGPEKRGDTGKKEAHR